MKTYSDIPEVTKVLERNKMAVLDIVSRMIASDVPQIDIKLTDDKNEYSVTATIKLDVKKIKADLDKQFEKKLEEKKKAESVDICDVDDKGNVIWAVNPKELIN